MLLSEGVRIRENTPIVTGSAAEAPKLGDVAHVHVALQERRSNLLQHLVEELVIDDRRSMQAPEPGPVPPTFFGSGDLTMAARLYQAECRSGSSGCSHWSCSKW